MRKKKKPFEEFDWEDFKDYLNRLFLQLLAAIFEEKGELTLADLENAYQQCRVLIQQALALVNDLENAYQQCRVLIQQALALVEKQRCLFWNSGENSVDPSKCCLAQLGDAVDLERYAVELAHNMKSYVVLGLYDQPEDKRLEMIDHLRTVFTMSSQVEIMSGDRSTFPEVCQVLGKEMNAIDQVMSGEDFQLKPALERFLGEVRPKIVLKIKKYSDHETLGYDECQFCNSRWVKKPNQPDIRISSNLSCFKKPKELESFWALRFRRIFYTELRDFVISMDVSIFSDDRFEN